MISTNKMYNIFFFFLGLLFLAIVSIYMVISVKRIAKERQLLRNGLYKLYSLMISLNVTVFLVIGHFILRLW